MLIYIISVFVKFRRYCLGTTMTVESLCSVVITALVSKF